MNESDLSDVLIDEDEQQEDSAQQQPASLNVGTLEPRILPSATWEDAGTDAAAVATETIDETVEAIGETDREDDGDEIDWSDATELHILDPVSVGEEIDDRLNRAEALLTGNLDSKGDGRSALRVVGEIVGSAHHQEIRLPNFDGDETPVDKLKPLRLTDADVQDVTQRLVLDDRADHAALDVHQRDGEESDAETAPKRVGVFAVLWGLMRGVAGTRRTEHRDSRLDTA